MSISLSDISYGLISIELGESRSYDLVALTKSVDLSLYLYGISGNKVFDYLKTLPLGLD